MLSILLMTICLLPCWLYIIYLCIAIQLKLLVRDTKGLPLVAMQDVLQLSPNTYVGVITGEASGATKEIANLLAVPMIERAVISCTATSPWLSKPNYYNLVRTSPSDAVLAKMMAKLMKSGLVGWWDLELSQRFSLDFWTHPRIASNVSQFCRGAATLLQDVYQNVATISSHSNFVADAKN